VVYTRWWARDLSVICGRVKIYDVKSVFEESDTWDERLSLNAVEI
jgi:hypothetical protein